MVDGGGGGSSSSNSSKSRRCRISFSVFLGFFFLSLIDEESDFSPFFSVFCYIRQYVWLTVCVCVCWRVQSSLGSFKVSKSSATLTRWWLWWWWLVLSLCFFHYVTWNGIVPIIFVARIDKQKSACIFHITLCSIEYITGNTEKIQKISVVLRIKPTLSCYFDIVMIENKNNVTDDWLE